MEKATEKLINQTPKKIIIWILGAIIMISLAFVFSNYLKERSPNAGDAMLKVVSSISDEIPDFPTFKRVDVNTSSRNTDACIYEVFESKSAYFEVEKYYSDYLLHNGWLKHNTERLGFRKGDYYFNLEHRSDKNTDWNYGVSICWKSNKL